MKTLSFLLIFLPCLTFAQVSESEFKKQTLSLEQRVTNIELKMHSAARTQRIGIGMSLVGMLVSGLGASLYAGENEASGGVLLIGGGALSLTGLITRWVAIEKLNTQQSQ